MFNAGAVVVLTVLLLAAVVVTLGRVVRAPRGRIPRPRLRLERFARRQRLIITRTNGALVLAYLATTRRWRGSGLLLALGIALIIAHSAGAGGSLNLSLVFVGWFVGAIVAEWRVDALARGPRIAASLRRRRLTDYVEKRVLVLVAIVWTAVLAVAALVCGLRVHGDLWRLGGLAGGETYPSRSGRSAVLVLVAALLTGAVLLIVARRVLTRAQPLTETDLLAADNALRGRSLHVLAGCSLAIGGYFLTLVASEFLSVELAGALFLARLIGLIVLPLFGALIAVGSRPSIERALVPVGAAA